MHLISDILSFNKTPFCLHKCRRIDMRWRITQTFTLSHCLRQTYSWGAPTKSERERVKEVLKYVLRRLTKWTLKLFSFLQTKHLDPSKPNSCDLPPLANTGLQGPAVGQGAEEEEMRTRFVFTAEVIKVVRAGLDKKQNELGDGLFFLDMIHRKEFANSWHVLQVYKQVCSMLWVIYSMCVIACIHLAKLCPISVQREVCCVDGSATESLWRTDRPPTLSNTFIPMNVSYISCEIHQCRWFNV